MDTNVSQRSWLILMPQLPAKPDYLRVKLQRRMHRIGAALVKNGVYALPLTDENTRASESLRGELVSDKGELIVVGAVLCAGLSDDDMMARFQDARATDYQNVAAAAREAAELPTRHGQRFELARVRKMLAAVERMDFFENSDRVVARDAVNELAEHVERRDGPVVNVPPGPVPPTHVWVTRAGTFVDRIASAWLIRRFIDPAATFRFIEAGASSKAKAEDTRFETPNGYFGHDGDRCTFETLVARFALDDAALEAIAEIVHDIECKDEKYQRAETPGVFAMLEGIRTSESADVGRIARGSPLFDALYAKFSAEPR